MGLRRITRGAGKVGLAIEAITYVVHGAGALIRAIRGRSSAANPAPQVAKDVEQSDAGASDERSPNNNNL